MLGKSIWILADAMLAPPMPALGREAVEQPHGHTLYRDELVSMDEAAQTAFLRGCAAGLRDQQMLMAVAAGQFLAAEAARASAPPEIDTTLLLAARGQSPKDAIWSRGAAMLTAFLCMSGEAG